MYIRSVIFMSSKTFNWALTGLLTMELTCDWKCINQRMFSEMRGSEFIQMRVCSILNIQDLKGHGRESI